MNLIWSLLLKCTKLQKLAFFFFLLKQKKNRRLESIPMRILMAYFICIRWYKNAWSVHKNCELSIAMRRECLLLYWLVFYCILDIFDPRVKTSKHNVYSKVALRLQVHRQNKKNIWKKSYRKYHKQTMFINTEWIIHLGLKIVVVFQSI